MSKMERTTDWDSLVGHVVVFCRYEAGGVRRS